MYYKKYCIILLLLCSIGIYPLFSKFVWPIAHKNITTVETRIVDEHIFIAVKGKGSVVAISAGKILHIRNQQENGLPSMISLLTKNALLITYLYVQSNVHIGQEVLAGEPIGYFREDETLLIRAYDINTQLDIDILSILPYIKRSIVIKLEDMTFHVEDDKTDVIEQYEIGRRIKSGNARVELLLRITDKRSDGAILPESLVLQVKKEQFVFQKDDIWFSDGQHKILPDGRILIVMPDVLIPRGYFDIRFTVKTPLGGIRRFKFNVFGFR